MKNKKFDCVKMMRSLRNNVHKEFENSNSDNYIEFLNKKYPNFSKEKNVLQKSK